MRAAEPLWSVEFQVVAVGFLSILDEGVGKQPDPDPLPLIGKYWANPSDNKLWAGNISKLSSLLSRV